MPALRARGLAVRIGSHEALRGIDLDVPARHRLVVLGANGAGKSVLLRTLHGLIEPAAGTLEWPGSSRRTSQAMVFQHPVMLRRSALANIEYALAIHGTSGEERVRAAHRALDRV